MEGLWRGRTKIRAKVEGKVKGTTGRNWRAIRKRRRGEDKGKWKEDAKERRWRRDHINRGHIQQEEGEEGEGARKEQKVEEGEEGGAMGTNQGGTLMMLNLAKGEDFCVCVCVCTRRETCWIGRGSSFTPLSLTEGERERGKEKETERARGSLASNVPSGRKRRREVRRGGGGRGRHEWGQSRGRKCICTVTNTSLLGEHSTFF